MGISKLVKDMRIRDRTGSLKMTLWDCAAAYVIPDVGDHVKVVDARFQYNTHCEEEELVANFPDQIMVSKVQ